MNNCHKIAPISLKKIGEKKENLRKIRNYPKGTDWFDS